MPFQNGVYLFPHRPIETPSVPDSPVLCQRIKGKTHKVYLTNQPLSDKNPKDILGAESARPGIFARSPKKIAAPPWTTGPIADFTAGDCLLLTDSIAGILTRRFQIATFAELSSCQKARSPFGGDPMADKNSPSMGKGLAQGLEVAVGVGLGYFIGHRLGTRYGWGPWGDFGGVVIGCAAGMYSLVKESVKSNKK